MYDAATATLESFYSLKVVSKSSSSLFFVTRVVKTLKGEFQRSIKLLFQQPGSIKQSAHMLMLAV